MYINWNGLQPRPIPKHKRKNNKNNCYIWAQSRKNGRPVIPSVCTHLYREKDCPIGKVHAPDDFQKIINSPSLTNKISRKRMKKDDDYREVYNWYGLIEVLNITCFASRLLRLGKDRCDQMVERVTHKGVDRFSQRR